MSRMFEVYDFQIGDTIVFDPSKVSNWGKLSGQEKYDHYGKFFYVSFGKPPDDAIFIAGSELYAIKPRLFTFVCEHSPQNGHGLVVDLINDPSRPRIITMVELDYFRKATLEEC